MNGGERTWLGESACLRVEHGRFAYLSLLGEVLRLLLSLTCSHVRCYTCILIAGFSKCERRIKGMEQVDSYVRSFQVYHGSVVEVIMDI